MFYWRYVKNAADEWEAELASQTWLWGSGLEESHVYISVPLIERESTQISISRNGLVAYTGDSGRKLYYSDGYSHVKLADEQCDTVAFCWINENTLLYTACTRISEIMGVPDEYKLRLWHTDTGKFEDYMILVKRSLFSDKAGKAIIAVQSSRMSTREMIFFMWNAPSIARELSRYEP